MLMSTIVGWLMALVALVGSPFGDGSQLERPAASASSTTAVVERVIDGDTLELAGGERVRLVGVDTPEVGDCYASEATAALREMVDQQTIRLEVDSSDRDRYDRLLRYIYVGSTSTTSVNEQMVVNGSARAIAIKPDTKWYGVFKEEERKARAARLGRWGACQ